MTQQLIDNSAVSTHLGKTSTYKTKYDPSLLVRELRQNNRNYLGIDPNNLPFVGTDTWNCYEVSILTTLGQPVALIVKIVYPCNSKYIVESKSLKLYLNSFNMEKRGKNSREATNWVFETVRADLSKLLEVDSRHIGINIMTNHAAYDCLGEHDLPHYWIKSDFITLESDYASALQNVEFTNYSESPELLEVVDSESDWTAYHSSLLRSNCRVTHQPDWGDVFIIMKKTGKTIDPISLLKYIVSFRDECHFHEEICEAIYMRLLKVLEPEQLVVRCLYTRRGGIDICPERSMNKLTLDPQLGNPHYYHIKTPRQ